MSFTGDLEHLSIVDVVQLLHATRKSGTLNVTGRKGTAQLVFSDGYIVSAGHFDERLRIGAILVEAGLLTREELQRTLAEQQGAGDRRRPLIATLIESGRVKKEDAFRGLESLIELTIVDILTWKSGSFTLDVGAVVVADEYRYFPEKLREDVHFHTENVLMEALRIFDEKKRDGRLVETEQEPKAAPAKAPPPGAEGVIALETESELSLSPDDLGLADVERLERRIPGVFSPIEDRPAISPHALAIREAAPELPADAQALLAGFLDGLQAQPASPAGLPIAVIVLGADALLAHCLAAVCRHQGFSVLATSEPGDVGPVANQHRGKGGVPVLVVDREGLARAGVTVGSQPHLGTVELANAEAPASAGPGGIRTVLTKPSRQGRGAAFVPELVDFLRSFPAGLHEHARELGAWSATAARRCSLRLHDPRSAGAVAEGVLASLTELGARSLALVLRGDELVTAGDAGLHVPGADAKPVPAVRIPLASSPLLRSTLEGGRCVIAPAGDEAVRAILHPVIGAPADPTILLVPLSASGRTVSLVYADFGAGPPTPPPADLLETYAALARAALELVLCRKKLEKPSR